MEIDLDNLVFSGLEEAQERNAERLEEADKKAQAVVADDDCGDACRSNDETGSSAGFLPASPGTDIKTPSTRPFYRSGAALRP
jgi:hypothetical protein